MALSTVEEYLSALEKSKLLGPDQLAQARRLGGESTDAGSLARALARDNIISRWQAGTLLALGERAQLRLGKYKFIQRLGKGGMGTVFLAEHVTMNRRVALKIVPRSIAENRASLDRFFAEARAIAALDHPNIVQAYSVDNEMDRYFIVMEFVDGADLQQLVDQSGPLPIPRAAEYIGQAAAGLTHAHTRNLVHCDIKPSNLLLNNQGAIKILDLGLARLNEGEKQRSGSSEPAFGTVDYMAPEQAMQTTNFDHRADIYSLGCTLYCLLTGHPPFPEGSLAQRIVKHQTQEPRPLATERPDAPQGLIDICRRMMAKQPEDRYQTMQEVGAALAPWRPATNESNSAINSIRAIKAVAEATPGSMAAAENWLASLGSPSGKTTQAASKASAAKMSTAKMSAAQSTKLERKPGIATRLAATFSGLLAFIRTKLQWINSPKRKIAAAAVGGLLLTALAAAASLPFVFGGSQPTPPEKLAAKAEEKKPVVDDAASGLGAKQIRAMPVIVPHPQTTPKPAPPKPKPAAPTQPQPKPEAVVKIAPPPIVAKENNPPKPEPMKPDEGANSDLLAGLSNSADIHPPGKGEGVAVALGKLELNDKADLHYQLLGGDSVAKGSPKFAIQKDPDDETAGWSIQATTKDKDAVKVARVWREHNELKFQWTADASKEKAGVLRFCGLQVSLENKNHLVALCEPKVSEPLVADFDAGATKVALVRDMLPDPSLLRLKILPLEKSLPASEIMIEEVKAAKGRGPKAKAADLVPGDTVPLKGHVVVSFTEAEAKAAKLKFNIAFTPRGKDILLEMHAKCEVAGNEVDFNLTSLQQIEAKVNLYLMTADANNYKGKKKPPNVPKELIQKAKAAQDELKALAKLSSELNHKLKIAYEVYVAVGEGSDAANVVLFRSGDGESAKPVPGTKRAPRPTVRGRVVPGNDKMDASQ